MTEPTSFETSLEEAERACFDELVRVLKLRTGVNAYIGISDGNPDCMVFDIGYIQTGEMTAFPASNYHFRASAEFYSRNRTTLQRTLMRLLEAMPIGHEFSPDSVLADTNVVNFRIAPETNAVGQITTTAVQMGKDGKTVPTFTATVLFDVVFLTGERDE